MKKLMLLSLLLVSAFFVNAQRDGANPEMRADKRVAHLTEALDLTTEQQADLKEVFLSQAPKDKGVGKKMQEMSQEEKEAFKAARKAEKAEMDEKIAAILTPAQLETYASLEKEDRGDRRGQNPNAEGAKGKKGKGDKGKGEKGKKGNSNASVEDKAQKKAAKLTEQLGLNADQEAQVRDLFLNQAARGGKPSKELSKEERQAMKATREEEKAAFDAGLAEILTPEQMTAFQNLPKPEKGKGKKKGKK